jgi:ribosomal protein S8E
MGITTSGLTKPYTAGGTIAKRRIVKFGAADGVVLQAAAATDLLIGVSTDLGSASGERQDVFMVGNIAEVDFGGTIARGASVTADASGKAVAAATGNIAIGYAEVSGVSGDVGTIVIARHVSA